MISHILVPTDFSDNAQRALPYALELARKSGADLTLFHAIEEPYNFASPAEGLKESARRKVKELLNEIIKETRAKPGYENITMQSLIYGGRPAHGIMEAAEDEKADLIVMGSRGAGALDRLLIGSVTAETVLHAPVPVLAVPENCSFGGIGHIAFATDYREGDLLALNYLTRLAALFGASLSVVHVAQHNSLENEIRFRGFRELAVEKIPRRSVERSFYPLFGKDLYRGLAEYLSNEEVKLMALVRYRKSFFHSLLEKNHVRQLELSTKIPLLVLVGDDTPWKGNLEL